MKNKSIIISQEDFRNDASGAIQKAKKANAQVIIVDKNGKTTATIYSPSNKQYFVGCEFDDLIEEFGFDETLECAKQVKLKALDQKLMDKSWDSAKELLESYGYDVDELLKEAAINVNFYKGKEK